VLSGPRRKEFPLKPVEAGKARAGSKNRIGKSQRCYSVVRPTKLDYNKNLNKWIELPGRFLLNVPGSQDSAD
jgi:hypothetical protein